MRELLELVRQRHSGRVPFDTERPLTVRELESLLEFGALGSNRAQHAKFRYHRGRRKRSRCDGPIRTEISETFLRENYLQMSFSGGRSPAQEDRRARKHVPDVLANATAETRTRRRRPCVPRWSDRTLSNFAHHSVRFAQARAGFRRRHPGVHEFRPVMQNMWLMAEFLGLAFQILSAFSAPNVELELRRI